MSIKDYLIRVFAGIKGSVAVLAGMVFLGCGLVSCDETNRPRTGGINTPDVISGDATSEGCARYVLDGTFIGAYRADDGTGNSTCTYATNFVDSNKPLRASITLSNRVDRHIFRGSLVVGRYARNRSELNEIGIGRGGDGPVLTIESGVVVAFADSDSFLLVNRGSQLNVNGTATAPVVLTSTSDPSIGGNAASDDNQLWGGVIINGFGVTNSCSYTGVRGESDFSLSNSEGCHVQSEGLQMGRASYYGGADDADNSGDIDYLIIKHAGAEVSTDNELNGLTLNAVGSGTTIDNLEIFQAYDDGVEFFGGAVNLSNYVAISVADDSIDIDAGYRGTVNRALIVQAETDGNRCVEADGIASYSDRSGAVTADIIARGLNSRPVLSNIVCVISANEGPDADASVAGSHDAGEGIRLREGLHGTLDGLLVTNAYSIASAVLSGSENDVGDNWCLDIDSDETLEAAAAGDLTIANSIFACSEPAEADGGMITAGSTATTESAWLSDRTNVYVATLSPLVNPGDETNPELALFEQNTATPLAVDNLMVPGVDNLTFTSQQPNYLDSNATTDWVGDWVFGLSDLWFIPSE